MARTKKDYLDDYLDADDFSYDPASDPIYNALKSEYLSAAKKTAEDVLGKYSQISGGGSVSSAAISAAGQAANAEKSKFADYIPKLYALAEEAYENDLDAKQKKLKTLLDYENFLSSRKSGSSGGKTDKKDEKDSDKAQSDTPDENQDIKDQSNGQSTNAAAKSLALKEDAAVEPTMAQNVYNMTKKLMSDLIGEGRQSEAEKMYSSLKNAMSRSQKSAIEKLFAK